MYDIFVYGLSVMWCVSALFTALRGILSLVNFERGSIQRKIGVLRLCWAPFDILAAFLLLFMYRNEVDSTWTVLVPTTLICGAFAAYIAIKAGLTHGGLREGIAIEANSFFSDLGKDIGRRVR